MFHPHDKLYFQVSFHGIFWECFQSSCIQTEGLLLCAHLHCHFSLLIQCTLSPLAPCSTRPWTPDGWHCLAVCLLAQMFIASICLWPMLIPWHLLIILNNILFQNSTYNIFWRWTTKSFFKIIFLMITAMNVITDFLVHFLSHSMTAPRRQATFFLLHMPKPQEVHSCFHKNDWHTNWLGFMIGNMVKT